MDTRRNSLVTTSTTTPNPRSRAGSFSGSIDVHHHDQAAGKLDYVYSGSRREFEVTEIANLRQIPGVGGMMHRQAEAMASGLGARRMTTATSQPGFFKKMGYDYTREQKGLNDIFGSAVVLQAESRQEKSGKAFVMEKDLRRESKCSVM